MEVMASINFGEQSTRDNGFVLEEPACGVLPSDEIQNAHVVREVPSPDEEHFSTALLESTGNGAAEAAEMTEVPRFEQVEEPPCMAAVSGSGPAVDEKAPEVFDRSILLPRWSLAKVNGPAIPIANMRGVDSLNYSNAEKRLRCKLASLYRLVEVFGWSDGISATISAITNSRDILMSPLGILHNEVTASDLLKVSVDGDILDPGSTGLDLDSDEVSLHSAIYKGRDDVQCVLHITSPTAVSFSILKCGLLPISPEAMELGEITYSNYTGAISTTEEQMQLGLVLNHNSKVMFLRSFGVVVCGDSVEQAFHTAQRVMDAVETQVKILPFGLANFHIPSDEKQRVVRDATRSVVPDVVPAKLNRRAEDVIFEGLMRMLDGAGFQTGYVHRHLQSSKRTVRSASMMDVAPSAKQSPVDRSKKILEHTRSVTPTSYRPESTRTCKSVIETELSPKPTANLQFVPLGTDIREYRRKVREIRKDFLGGTASGPYSTVLEGVTWEEAQRLQESRTGGHVDAGVKVVAASRGIIQRDHQKEAIFYKDYSAVNPFDAANQRDIESYVTHVRTLATSPEPCDVLVSPNADKTEVLLKVSELHSPSDKLITKLEPVDTVKSTEERVEVRRDKTEAKTEDKKEQVESVFVSLNFSTSASETGARSIVKTEELGGGDIKECVTVQPQKAVQEPVPTEKVVVPVTSPVTPVTPVEAKEEVKHEPQHLMQHPEAEGPRAKLQKSASVKESKSKKPEPALTEENTSEGVEMRAKEKDKKKKRGLSAIFSKKKGS